MRAFKKLLPSMPAPAPACRSPGRLSQCTHVQASRSRPGMIHWQPQRPVADSSPSPLPPGRGPGWLQASRAGGEGGLCTVGVSRGRLAGGRLSQPRCAWERGESGTQRGPGLSRELAPSPRSVLMATALTAACRHGHAGRTASLSSTGSSLSLSRVLVHWGVVHADQESRRRSCGGREGPRTATCEPEHFLPPLVVTERSHLPAL